MTIANLRIDLSAVEQWAAHKHAELDCCIPDDDAEGRAVLDALTRLGEAADNFLLATVLSILLGDTLKELGASSLIKLV